MVKFQEIPGESIQQRAERFRKFVDEEFLMGSDYFLLVHEDGTEDYSEVGLYPSYAGDLAGDEDDFFYPESELS
jgi:hypothetical protein